MSLEQAIERNNQLLEQLIQIMSHPRMVVEQQQLPTDLDIQRGEDPEENERRFAAAQAHAAEYDKKAAAKRAKKKEAAPEPRPLEPIAPSQEAGAPDASATAAAAPATEATRGQVSKALMSVSAKHGRDAAFSVLREVAGVASLSDAAADTYPTLLTALEAKLNG